MRQSGVLITIGLLAGVAGCGSSDPPTKAAGDSPPITLTARATTGPGAPGGDQLAEFARQAGELSAGDISINVVDPLEGGANSETPTVKAVQSGEVDIGFVPARVFDTLGVNSLRALQAPFLIDSNELADKVLADSVADDMLAGLGDVGLTGLALTFDSLRQPVGTTAPLIEPADFAGAAIQVVAGDTQRSIFTALGATISDAVDAELTVGIAEGRIQGREGSMQVPVGATTGPITGNAVMYVKAITVFANSKRFSGLTDQQRDVLRRAAVAARDWESRQHKDLVNAAAAYCADGKGDVVLASAAQLAALKEATASVEAGLSEDAMTRATIEKIEAIKATVPAQPVLTACAAPGSSTAASTTTVVGECSLDNPQSATGTDQTAIDGVWRWEVNLDPNADRPGAAHAATANNGTWTWIFNNGHKRSIEPDGNSHDGTYVLCGNTMFNRDDDGVEGASTFERDGDSMKVTPKQGTMTDVELELELAIMAPPLQRIGDPTIEPGNNG